MKIASSLATIVALASSLSSTHAAVFYEAEELSPAIIKAAVSAEGADSVYLRNVKTGRYLAYTRAQDTPDLTFTSSPYKIALRDLGGNRYAFGFAEDNYCLSSAWNFTLGLNEYSTLYRCCTEGSHCDNGNEEFGPLRVAKQQLYIVPVHENALVTMVKAIVKSGIDLLKRNGDGAGFATAEHRDAVALAKKHLRMTKRERLEFERRCAKHRQQNADLVTDSKVTVKKPSHKELAANIKAQQAKAAAAEAEKLAEEQAEAEAQAKQEEAEELARQQKAAAEKAAAEKAAADKAAEEAEEQAAAEKAAAEKAAEEKAAKEAAEAKEAEAAAKKKSSGGGSNVIARVQIIAVDHLHDMLTRTLSCNLIMGAGNYMSVRLDVLDTNDECQQWDLIRA